MRSGVAVAGLVGLALGLSGCGGNLLGSSSNIFGSSKATSNDTAAGVGGAAGVGAVAASDVECPSVTIRTGAATLSIGKPGDTGEPSALDLRYQGSILRTARECHVNAGMMSMKVGVEGRIITGPAGGPGNVEVPLRIAIVKEGVEPKPIVSHFARIPVTVTGDNDRVTFTHVDSEIAFPMPQPVSDIDAYVVYVGFDQLAAPAPRKSAPKRSRAKPR
jgi:hypothetical protein